MHLPRCVSMVGAAAVARGVAPRLSFMHAPRATKKSIYGRGINYAHMQLLYKPRINFHVFEISSVIFSYMCSYM